MKEALLIIDVQNDYFPNGKCELYRSEMALEKIKKLLEYFRNSKLPIFYIQHISGEKAPFFVPNTNGVNIHSDITPLKNEKIIQKSYPNSFLKTNLQEEFQNASVTDLIVCGMMTHMCVDTTVRAAKDFFYNVTLISDCCATKNLQWDNEEIPANVVQDVFLAALNGKFANVVTCSEYIKSVAK